jgi:NarL family two-component system response regulator LiaR
LTDAIRVLIVDDHAVVRQGLRTFLQTQDDVEIAGEAADGDEAVSQVRELVPDVVLMDLVMPKLDGIAAIREIRALSPSTKVLVLTSFADDDKVFAAVKAGAAGYLLKDVRPQELGDAIRTVNRGEALLHPTVAAKLMQELAQSGRRQVSPDSLTDRELDVLRLIARGMSNKEIALELGVAEKTVKTHVSNILQKLHLADRTQAALYAVRERLVDLE